MSKGARLRFADQCSREADQVMRVASAEQMVLAIKQGVIPAFQSGKTMDAQAVRDTQRKRRNNKGLSTFTELFGVRLPKPDDPVLLRYKTEDDDSRPLRLVIR
jgi:hypothetical protein